MTQSSSVPDNWYEAFFTGPINAFWEALVPQEVTQLEIAFIERHLQLTSAAHVLDVPCGAGRHCFALARLGYSVTGIDLSNDAIERARAKACSETLRVQLLQQDMCHLQLDTSFDGAICMGNCFGYLTHTGMQAFLSSIHDSLRVGARLLIDSGMAAESVLANLEREAKYEMDGYVFEIKNDYDIARSRLFTHTVLRRDERQWNQSFSHGVYTCGELCRMLGEHGFAIEGLYSDLNDTPFALSQSRLLLVASRR
jgi:cyclopropane fatty-acyl-phospholipid synthase-like methyltransferase